MAQYVLDTNVISDLIINHSTVWTHLRFYASDTVYLCQPVYFESRRGLLWKGAQVKLKALESLRNLLTWVELTDDDWEQAARFWANAQKQGRQLADVDLLIAALAVRLDAILISADDDFDVLPVQRGNWRIP